ncbi:MAG: glycosyltransferase [Rhodospirillaceae bacterium]
MAFLDIRLAEALDQVEAEKQAVAKLTGLLHARDATCQTQQIHIVQLTDKIAALYASSSWRITAPFRMLVQGLKAAARGRSPRTSLPAGYLGTLESATNGQVISHDTVLPLHGWLFCVNEPIQDMVVMLDDKFAAVIPVEQTRRDVGDTFPGHPAALNSAFYGQILLGQPKKNRTLHATLAARFADGRTVPCFAVRIRHRLPPDAPSLSNWLRRSLRAGIFVCNHLRHGRLPSRQEIRTHLDGPQTPTGLPILHDWQRQTAYRRWQGINRLTKRLVACMRDDAARLAADGPLISLIVPTYNTPATFLIELLDSVTAQIYPKWELCIADDASTDPSVRTTLERAASADSRIKLVFRPSNGHICHATNSALELATGDFIALLDHDDLLTADALLHIAEAAVRQPGLDYIYTDEDKIDKSGNRFDPQFKANWSPETALTHNYTHHLSVIRRTLVNRVGNMRPGFEGAQDIDLLLRVFELTDADRICHIPHICYHWRDHPGSSASAGNQKSYIFDSARRAIEEAFNRRNLKASPVLPEIAEKYRMCLYQPQWSDDVLSGHVVTVVIPTKDRADLLEACVKSLESTLPAGAIHLIIVDDRSTQKATFALFEKFKEIKNFEVTVIRNEPADNSFNFSSLVNLALRATRTEHVLLLNNDIVATKPGWLTDLMGWLSIPGVGAVGAKLYYPDGKIQHAGIVIEGPAGLPDHFFHRLPADVPSYLALPHAARNVSAVTGACMLFRRSDFWKVGGFDDTLFKVEFNDVDFCLKLLNAGLRIVVSPQASLIHVTSASRGFSFHPQEHLNFLTKYAGIRDTYFNPNFDRSHVTMEVDPLRFAYADRIGPLKILLVSHELTLTGAPIVLYGYARYFVEQMGCAVELVSVADGPLRERFAALGVPIHILEDMKPYQTAPADTIAGELMAAVSVLAPARFDLMVVNSLLSMWAIHLAQLARLPSIWHLHEYPASFNISDETLDTALNKANRVVFQADRTRTYYHSFDRNGRFRTIRGGLPLDDIDAFRARWSKMELRAKHSIPVDHCVISLIGTFSERKGQHVMIDAIKALKELPGVSLNRTTFTLVGARPGAYLTYITQQIEAATLSNVLIFDETPEIYDFFHLSDVFVCASCQESYPMVVLLAMAFELIIVSTDVDGIPEIIDNNGEGMLFRSPDSAALADHLATIVAEPGKPEIRQLAQRARARVLRCNNNMFLMPRHGELLKEVYCEGVVDG